MASTEDREKELAELEKELESAQLPFIERPETIDDTDGAVCFLNVDRICGPDCKAFDPTVSPPQGPEQCLILGNLLDVASLLRKPIEAATREAQDRAREAIANMPIPGVRR